MTITMLARKGGVGKTALSVLLHEAFRQANKTVTIRDWDSQGTSTRALSFINNGAATSQSGKYDILIYDTPPSLEHTATISAVMAADIVLIVTTPAPADLWEVEAAAKLTETKNPKAIARIVFNRVRRTTLLGRLMDESSKQLSLPTLGSSVTARECYQHAIGQGWKALDAPAREEVLRFATEVLALKALHA